MYLVIGVILFVLALILWANREHWQLRIYKHVKDIPGPPSIPFVGNILPYVGTLDVIWKHARNLAIEYDGLYKIWAGNRCAIFISDPNYNEIILSSTKNIEKSEPYNLLESWLGQGLLISGGEKWKSRRKILTPAFHFHILKQFINVFEEQSDRTVKMIREECDKPYTNVIPLAAEHALCALCETTMGIKMDNYENLQDFNRYKEAIYQFGHLFMDRVKNPLLYSEKIYSFTPMARVTKKLYGILKKFTLRVIDERLANWDDEQKKIMTSASGKQLFPMLDILITEMKNGGDINYDGIREEVDTFMFEGHDTTSMGLSFLLMLLAQHPEVQEKILEEQNQIFNGDNRIATYEDLQNMKYLEMVIKESLRLYPAVPVLGRKVTEDVQLGPYTIPADVQVYIVVFDTHHNPNYWPDPYKFDPDRFLPDNCAKRHPFAYIPFSAGSRNCIGQRFVMLEMKSFVTKILREYVLEPVDDLSKVVMKIDLVIRPLNDNLRVKFRRRNDNNNTK